MCHYVTWHDIFDSVAKLKVQNGQECLKELLQLGKDQIQEQCNKSVNGYEHC